MADDPLEDAGHDPAAGPPGKKKPDHKSTIYVVLAAAGVIIAWLTYRKLSGSSSTSPAGTSTASVPTQSVAGSVDPAAQTGTVASYTGTDPSGNIDYYLQLEQQLNTLQSEVQTPASGQSTAYHQLPSNFAAQNPVFVRPTGGQAGYFLQR